MQKLFLFNVATAASGAVISHPMKLEKVGHQVKGRESRSSVAKTNPNAKVPSFGNLKPRARRDETNMAPVNYSMFNTLSNKERHGGKSVPTFDSRKATIPSVPTTKEEPTSPESASLQEEHVEEPTEEDVEEPAVPRDSAESISHPMKLEKVGHQVKGRESRSSVKKTNPNAKVPSFGNLKPRVRRDKTNMAPVNYSMFQQNNKVRHGGNYVPTFDSRKATIPSVVTKEQPTVTSGAVSEGDQTPEHDVEKPDDVDPLLEAAENGDYATFKSIAKERGLGEKFELTYVTDGTGGGDHIPFIKREHRSEDLLMAATKGKDPEILKYLNADPYLNFKAKKIQEQYGAYRKQQRAKNVAAAQIEAANAEQAAKAEAEAKILEAVRFNRENDCEANRYDAEDTCEGWAAHGQAKHAELEEERAQIAADKKDPAPGKKRVKKPEGHLSTLEEENGPREDPLQQQLNKNIRDAVMGAHQRIKEKEQKQKDDFQVRYNNGIQESKERKEKQDHNRQVEKGKGVFADAAKAGKEKQDHNLEEELEEPTSTDSASQPTFLSSPKTDPVPDSGCGCFSCFRRLKAKVTNSGCGCFSFFRRLFGY